MSHFTRTIRRFQDIMRKDPGLDGDAQRIAQLSWLLLLRVIDEHDSVLPEGLNWSDWVLARPTLSGQPLIRFVDDELLPGLQALASQPDARMRRVGNAFLSVSSYMRDGTVLRELIDAIHSDLEPSTAGDVHFMGTIYEKILADLQNAGNAGEFYTPRALTDLVAHLLDPLPTDHILDPACGTGGFLVSCLTRVTQTHGLTDAQVSTMGHRLHGVEKKALPHFLALANLLLHGVADPAHVAHGNFLEVPCGEWPEAGTIDVVATNPPFGGREASTVKQNVPTQFRSTDTSDLFLVHLIDALKVGGRAAVVLPDGFLFGGGVKARIRQHLLHTCNLHTLLRLPRGVFNPYTGISTNVLFFRKGEPTKAVWFVEHRYPEGQRNYTKTQPVRLEEFGYLSRWWNDRVETDQAWTVDVSVIREADWSLDQSNPASHAERTARPDAQVSEIKKLRRSSQQRVKALDGWLTKYTEPRRTKGRSLVRDHLDTFANTEKGIDALERIVLRCAFAFDQSNGCRPVTDLLEDPALDVTNGWPRVPSHWAWCRLGDLGKVTGGGTPRADDDANFAAAPEGIPWLTPADLNGHTKKYIAVGRRNLSERGLASSSARLLAPRSVLFSSRAPIGYVAIADCALATNQGFKSIELHDSTNAEYVYYYLKCVSSIIERDASGTTFKEVPARQMKQIPIPVPPAEDRDAVVGRLDEAVRDLTALREIRVKAIAVESELVSELVAYVAT